MIEIFKKYKEIKYVKLKGHTKSPFEKDWQNKPYSFDEIKNHFNHSENYGVLGGYGDLIILDCDKVTSSKDKNERFPHLDEELSDTIKTKLPNTLTIQSGSGAKHYYFFCKGLSKKVILKSQRDNNHYHWGEILTKGSQAVGPGSIHPETQQKYKIINKAEIQHIDIITLYNVLKPFIPSLNEKETYGEPSQGIDDLKVTDIFSTSGLKRNGDGQLYGAHPVHGSQGGANFWIDPVKNTWYCFRCEAGGGPAAAIAVNSGVCTCSSVGNLRGSLFKEVLTIARKDYNLKDKKPEVVKDAESFEVIKEEEDKLKLNLWTFEDFENYEVDHSFLVDKVIYPKTVTMLYSPPGEFKSIMAVFMALAIAQGKPWVGFDTQQNAVLYCDKENNDRIIKERLMALYKGHDYNDKKMPLYFLRREGDLIKDKRADQAFIKKLFYNIETYNIKVVFFDTMHRFGDYDENSSDDINLLYTQVFQPLIEEYGCSVIFLHHTNKDGNFRGSGDFLGMVDTAYKFKRKGKVGAKSNKFQIINEKNRSGEVETIDAELEFNSKLEGDIEILDSVEVIVDENEPVKKNDDFYSKVKNCIKKGELKYKRDIKALLENQNIEFSESKLKRALAWLVEKDVLIRDSMNRYKLTLDTFVSEDITEDLENE